MSLVAREPLYIGIHRAHNPGDVVPEAHVKKYGWEGSVESTEEQFDPAQHNSEAVLAYLATAAPEEQERVLAAERGGKARRAVLGQ